MVGTDYVSRMIGRNSRSVTNYATDGTIPDDCIADRGGDGGPWKFHRGRIDAWISRFLSEGTGRQRKG